MISTKQQIYFDNWRLGAPHKKLETHSSFLYWCQQDDLPVVLKIYKSHSDEAAAVNLLRHYDGFGAVKVLVHDEGACLLEQVGNGRELVELTRAGDDGSATEILCDVIGKLHSAAAIDIGLRPVDEFVADFDAYLARDFVAERDLVERARRIYADLSAGQGAKLNLHGDLHHYNMMQTADDGVWLAIDPKGYWGEAEYELGAFLRNPLADDFLGIDMAGRFDIIEARLGYDMERVKQWAFCQAVLASVWANDNMVFARRMVGQF